MKNKILKIFMLLMYILLFFVSIVLIGSYYYYTQYPKQDFDIILFTLRANVQNSSSDVVRNIILSCLPGVICVFIILLIPTIRHMKSSICLNLKFKQKKEKQIQLVPIRFISKHRFMYVTTLCIISVFVFVKCFRIDEYIKFQRQNSTIFEECYVDRRNVTLNFPDQNRNLILILGESYETTLLSKENGGAWEYSIMPEMEQLALNNISFSNTDKLGGALTSYGMNYSAAGNVAITSGVPIKTTEYREDYNAYKGSANYLSGVYSLGEVLRERNYNLEIMTGSDAYFGNRRQYYESNGNYKIFDMYYAIDNGKMTRDEAVWWGFEDDKLYAWSKEELTNLANQGQPFNYIMLTADTHYTDGYLSANVESKYPTQYENVYAYSSKSMNEFIDWIKAQDFYENTTIVIIGDHLGMQNKFYEDGIGDQEYTRTVYNTFINSVATPLNQKNRIFTLVDMYPTILASMGITIEGDRLGLGTNLFSNRATLAEEMGYETFNTELRKNSSFYNEKIASEDYYLMKRDDDNHRDD